MDMKKIIVFMLVALAAVLCAAPIDNLTNAVGIAGGDPERAFRVYSNVFKVLGVIFPAVYLVAALDPSNKVARGLDRVHALLKIFGPLDKKK
jgi:hypothetical protein